MQTRDGEQITQTDNAFILYEGKNKFDVKVENVIIHERQSLNRNI